LTGLPSQNRSQRDARPICQADRVQPWLSLRNGERSCSRRYAASCIFFDFCLAVLVYWSKSKPVLIDAWVSSGPLPVEGDELGNKLTRIREIRIAGFEVLHVIHRHGMDDRNRSINPILPRCC